MSIALIDDIDELEKMYAGLKRIYDGTVEETFKQIGDYQSKLKMVALGAVMHKVCNIIFAVLRDNKEFVVISQHEHIVAYHDKLVVSF